MSSRDIGSEDDGKCVDCVRKKMERIVREVKSDER